jgi:hypothetical protein
MAGTKRFQEIAGINAIWDKNISYFKNWRYIYHQVA